ncbi:hypothetical protein QQY66_38260 [Streptomyces sp. DG2A-72]|uniref:hypothetical protein n=1 Tax=Streptomyces sp. DG2A-72 TaxID=3051386 RepID=UPI00265C5481|nr:hypothetical protein [Streptomyces sp. DG2A-72]MDO0937285.1 hypothetical protein [Streptomyces sp. DG2A-72]
MARLRELPRLYDECERVLGGAAAPSVGERRGAGGQVLGIPLNGAAAEARSAIVATLSSWCGLVADERGFPVPRRTPFQLASYLLRSADWLAAHPAAADATREVAGLVAGARRVVQPNPVRRVRLGACVETGCGGELTASVGARRAEPPATVQCDADPAHSWAGHEWTRLRWSMQQRPAAPGIPTERWLTASEISYMWSAPTGTVYRLASEQRWRRRNRHGRTYYAEIDVHGSFSRRAARSA